MPLRTAQIEDIDSALVRQIEQGDSSGVTALFDCVGAPAPLVLWSPDTRMAGAALVNRFADICDKLATEDGCIPRARFSLDRFSRMADWMMVLSPESDRRSYVYDHYGAGIAQVYGVDMTGQDISRFQGHISRFFMATYTAAARRRERLMTLHQPPRQVFVTQWRRYVVPLTGPAGEDAGFVVLNTPENELRAGLEVLPLAVLIADADQVVRYANKAARERFDKGADGPWTRSLFDYGGLDLDIAAAPGDILLQGAVQTTTCRNVDHNQIHRFSVTVSATLHHDVAFYVILLQPIEP